MPIAIRKFPAHDDSLALLLLKAKNIPARINIANKLTPILLDIPGVFATGIDAHI